MSVFWISPNGQQTTYQQLLEFLASPAKLPFVLRQANGFNVIATLMALFLRGESAVLVDHGLQEAEIATLGIEPDDLAKQVTVASLETGSMQDVWGRLMNQEDARVFMFTSGTTGRPKKVGHTWGTLTRAVRRSSEHKSDVWALAYHPAHFAGLQVMMQAIGNQNPIVDLFSATGAQARHIINTIGITHISATPAFYRRMLLDIDTPVNSIKQVTCGGEKYDSALIPLLQQAFPNAKVRNVYASTEAGSLFSAKDDVFKPGQRMLPFIKVSAEGELWVHQSLLGQFDSTDLTDGWYKTGDLVQKEADGSFRFISRKQDFINVGGYKVNPLEVEDLIRTVTGVVDCLIKARANSVLGNILQAVVQAAPGQDTDALEKDIYAILKQSLQPYKIPRIITFTNQIERSRTGKRKRT